MGRAFSRVGGWNFVLACTLGALVVAYLSTKTAPPPTPVRLLGLDSEASVQELIVEGKEGTVHVVRADTGPDWRRSRWRIDTPVIADANHAAVRELVSILSNLEPERTVVGDKEESFGFASPQVAIHVLDTLGHKSTLTVGETSEFSGAVYTKSSSRPGVHLISKDVVYSLTQSWIHLRRRRLFGATSDEVSSVRIEKDSKNYEVQRAEDGTLTLRLDGEFSPANQQRALRLIETLVGVEAQEFVEEVGASETLGLESRGEPDVTVVVSKGERSERAEFWYEEEEDSSMLLVMASFPKPALVRVPAARVWPVLQADENLLRDARLQSFDPKEVRSLHLTPPEGAAFSIERTGDRWSISSGKAAARSEVLVSLHRLASLEARTFQPSPAPPAPQKPAIRVKLDQDTLEWRFGPLEGDLQRVWTRRNSDSWSETRVRASFERAFAWSAASYLESQAPQEASE